MGALPAIPQPKCWPPTCAITAGLVDGQSLLRAGIRALLETEDDITVAGEADDGDAGVRQAYESGLIRPGWMIAD